MKKKKIISVLAIIAIAAFSFIKANKSEELSDVVLRNIEALADNELAYNEYICYGTGKVTCPYSGLKVAGYYIKRNIE